MNNSKGPEVGKGSIPAKEQEGEWRTFLISNPEMQKVMKQDIIINKSSRPRKL